MIYRENERHAYNYKKRWIGQEGLIGFHLTNLPYVELHPLKVNRIIFLVCACILSIDVNSKTK